MKALLIGDAHLSDTAPSIRTETYADDILDKLRFCVKLANEMCDVIVQLGDLFHVKRPSRTSHRLVQRTAEVFSEFRGRVLIVPGNHDMSNDRLESLESQPLGSLALSPNIDLLVGLDKESGLFGIPYFDDFGEFKEMLAEAVDFGPNLIAVHASLFPPGIHPPYPHMNADELDTGGIPLAAGHIHDPHGLYQANGAWFCNNGAISRGSLHEETLKRSPAVTIFDTSAQGCPFQTVPVPHKPAAEVFRLAEHAEVQAAAAKLDGFLGGLQAVSLTSLNLEDVTHHAIQAGLSPEAQAELSDIIQTVAH